MLQYLNIIRTNFLLDNIYCWIKDICYTIGKELKAMSEVMLRRLQVFSICR